MQINKIYFCLVFCVFTLFAFASFASTLHKITGTAVQIKDGLVEIKAPSGAIEKLVFKKLPPDLQDKVKRSIANHKIITLEVTESMFHIN